ncbi:hypothetical protein DPMN_102765 [Dreissena polymorpha]|uniref:Uncharacterized protein n=1 Tax=Dreissena polymorpha TaxID=45954 RepID=A0A9D4LLJ0_DREPO|nr:hypothetical protein DPMN_102765 [Dreissena polymorpha]
MVQLGGKDTWLDNGPTQRKRHLVLQWSNSKEDIFGWTMVQHSGRDKLVGQWSNSRVDIFCRTMVQLRGRATQR